MRKGCTYKLKYYKYPKRQKLNSVFTYNCGFKSKEIQEVSYRNRYATTSLLAIYKTDKLLIR